MQIHELNNFTGTLGSGAYLAIDDGTDTGKISSQGLLAATKARIDNIIAGPAPSAEEIVDARLGADGVTYPSLGDAIRDQFTDVKSALSAYKASLYMKNLIGPVKNEKYPVFIPKGTKLCVSVSDGTPVSGDVPLYIGKEDGSTIDWFNITNGDTYRVFTVPNTYDVYYVWFTTSNITLQLEVGNTPTAYTPYVTSMQKMLDDINNIRRNGYYNLIGNQKNVFYDVYIPSKSNITMGTLDGNNASADFTLYLLDSTGTQLDYFTLNSGAKTRTISLNLSADVYRVRYDSTSEQGLQLVLGDSIIFNQQYLGSNYAIKKALDERKENIKLLETLENNNFQRIDLTSDLEVGTMTLGQPDTSTIRLRSSEFHELASSPIIFKFFSTKYTVAVEEYRSDKTWIKESDWLDNSADRTYTPSDSCKYIKIILKGTTEINFIRNGIPVLFGFTTEYTNNTLSKITLAGIEIDNEHDTVTSSALRTALGIDSSSANKLKVMSFNVGLYTEGINRDWTSADDAGITKMRQILSKENCDVLGLTEVRPTIDDSTESALIYDYLYPNKSESSSLGGSGIFSRLAISNSNTGTWTDGRGYRYTTLNVGGTEVFFLLLHLNPDWTDKRETEISEVLALLAQHDTFIACGDFNAGNLHSDWRSEYAPYLNAGYHLANAGYLGDMVTFPSNNSYLDNIITSSDIIICNSYVPSITDNPSDHLPIIAELMIT